MSYDDRETLDGLDLQCTAGTAAHAIEQDVRSAICKKGLALRTLNLKKRFTKPTALKSH